MCLFNFLAIYIYVIIVSEVEIIVERGVGGLSLTKQLLPLPPQLTNQTNQLTHQLTIMPLQSLIL